MPDYPVLYYQNVNGLRSKLEYFRDNFLLLAKTPDIIIFVETNLTQNISDNELGLNDYLIYRRDRYMDDNVLKGGGILIAIRKCFSSNIVFCDYKIDCEQLFISMNVSNLKIIIGAVYIPPNSPSDKYSCHVDTVEEIYFKNCDKCEFIILGDFNLPRTTWINCNDTDDSLNAVCCHPDILIRENSCIVVNCFSFLNFYQRCNVHNKKGYTLDLCFTSLDFSVIENLLISETLIPADRHHDPTVFKLKIIKDSYIKNNYTRKNFYRAEFEVINESILNTNWNDLLNNTDIEVNVNNFNCNLQNLIDSNVPNCKEQFKSTYPSWFSFDLIKNTLVKKKLHKIWISTDNQEDYIEFKKQRALCLRMSKLDQKRYYDEIQNRCKSNIKEFWKYVNGLSKGNSIPEFVNYKGYSSASSTESCNLFATYFKSTFSMQWTDFILEGLDDLSDLSFDSVITESEIVSALNSVSDSVSIGVDNFPQIIAKKCGVSLIKPLLVLFNQSVSNGLVPKVWKKSFITPIFKSGDKNCVENYRPISILGTFAKILDCIICSKLTFSLVSKVILEQHGFVEGKSTLSNLLIYSDFVSTSLNSGFQVDTVYLDFKKAFDSVNHSILLNKLYVIGLRGSILYWLKSYLTDRESAVRIKGNLSDSFVVNSGVPQGSHLGPFLFLLFINDIAKDLKYSNILIFADDVKLFSKICSPHDQSKLQADLNTIIEWAKINELELNTDKCSLLILRRGEIFHTSYLVNGVELKRVHEQKDLGVTFQENYEFDVHLKSVVSKSFKVLGFIIRSSSKFKGETIIYLYKTLCLPILLYNSQIWSPHYANHVKLLESVQHKFFRYLAFRLGKPFSFDNHDYSTFSESVKLCSIKSLHDYHDLLFVRKILSLPLPNVGDTLIKLFPLRENRFNTRRHRDLLEFNSNRDYVYHSVIFRLRRSWNLLNANVKLSASMNDFKNLLFQNVCKFK